MTSRLAAIRKAREISAVDLAAQVGVTRQAIYAIEAGTYMPNTAVALRLARCWKLRLKICSRWKLKNAPRARRRCSKPWT